MASIMELSKKTFGQSVTLYKNVGTYLMDGSLKLPDISEESGTTITAVICKQNATITQESDGRVISSPAYIMVSSDVDINNDDVIKTGIDYFIVHQLTHKNNSITGSIGDDAEYKRADLELFEYV